MTPEARAAYIVGCIRNAADIHVTEAEKLLAEHDAHRRTQVLTEAKTEVVAWLVKKAAEQKTWAAGVLASKVDRGAVRAFIGTEHYRDAMDAHRAEVLTEAAAELDRIADTVEARVAEHYGAASGIGPGSAQMLRDAAGNVRYMAGKDTGDGTQPPAGEPTQPAADFFQPGHAYTHRNGTDFRCVAVTTHPETGEARAFGWRSNGGWHLADTLDPDDWRQYDGYEPPALSADLAAYVAAGTCTCLAYPAAHRADLHNERGMVRDITPEASGGWAALVHARCARCGWKSRQTWLHEEFTTSPVQTYIAAHRDQWTGVCVAPAGESDIPEGEAPRG